MSLIPDLKEDKMPHRIDHHCTTLEYEIGCFTRIACANPVKHTRTCNKFRLVNWLTRRRS